MTYKHTNIRKHNYNTIFNWLLFSLFFFSFFISTNTGTKNNYTKLGTGYSPGHMGLIINIQINCIIINNHPKSSRPFPLSDVGPTAGQPPLHLPVVIIIIRAPSGWTKINYTKMKFYDNEAYGMWKILVKPYYLWQRKNNTAFHLLLYFWWKNMEKTFGLIFHSFLYLQK